MTIHELDPLLRVGPIKIGSRLGAEVTSFPKEVGEAIVYFQRGPVVLDVDEELYRKKVSVTVITPDMVMLDHDGSLVIRKEEINQTPGLKKRVRWTENK